jgi:hypothetical protein
MRSVAAAEPARLRSAEFGCVAVVNPANAVYLMHRKFWFDDCYAAERSLASSTAATAERSLRQLLFGMLKRGRFS